MSENVQGTFISEKISKIRWQHGNLTEAKHFLTGSWDNPVRLCWLYLTLKFGHIKSCMCLKERLYHIYNLTNNLFGQLLFKYFKTIVHLKYTLLYYLGFFVYII